MKNQIMHRMPKYWLIHHLTIAYILMLASPWFGFAQCLTPTEPTNLLDMQGAVPTSGKFQGWKWTRKDPAASSFIGSSRLVIGYIPVKEKPFSQTKQDGNTITIDGQKYTIIASKDKSSTTTLNYSDLSATQNYSLLIRNNSDCDDPWRIIRFRAGPNSTPTLGAVPTQTIREGQQIEIRVKGSDKDWPFQDVTYSLLSPPEGAIISKVPVSNATPEAVVNWTPNGQQGGRTHPITVKIEDNNLGGFASSTMTFNVIVDEVNHSPILTPISNQVIQEEVRFSLTINAADTDIPGDPLRFDLLNPQEGMSLDATSGAFSWTPSEKQGPGSYPVTVRVTDKSLDPINPSLSDTKTFTVEVREANRAPILTATPDQVIQEEVKLSLNITGTDADIPGNPLQFELLNPQEGMSLDATSGAFSWTPSEQQGPGSYPVTVRVTDKSGDPSSPSLSDTKTFSIRVTEVNRAPTIQPFEFGSKPPIDLSTALVGVPWTTKAIAADVDAPPQTLTFQMTKAPEGMTIDPASGTISWTPKASQTVQTFPVTVTVADGQGGIGTRDFSIAVQNTLPTLRDVANQSTQVGVPWSLQLIASDVDAPPQTLTFQLTKAPEGMTIDPASGKISWTPKASQTLQTFPVTGTVADGQGGSATRDFSIAVQNTLPTLRDVANQSTQVGVPWSLQLIASDVDAPPQTLTFQLTKAPEGMTIDPASGTISWTPKASQTVQTFPVTVTVADGQGDSATRDFSIAVQNTFPTLRDVANQSTQVGVPWSLQLIASDVDAPTQSLTFQLTKAPEGMTIDPASGKISWTPKASQTLQTFPVTVTVADGQGGSATRDFSIAVQNTLPTLRDVANQSTQVGVPWSLQLIAADVDAPPQTLTFQLTKAPEGMTIDPASGKISWTPKASQTVQTFPVTVTVADGQGDSATRDFSIAVQNTLPTLRDVANQSTQVGVPWSLQLIAADVDAPPQTLTFQLTKAPEGMTIDPASGKISWTPKASQTLQTFPVTVTVADGQGGSATRDFSIAVQNTLPTLRDVANQSTQVGVPWSLQLIASDVDAPPQSLTFKLIQAPEGMTIDPNGKLSWVPIIQQAGKDHTVTVQVEDGAGGRAQQSFVISIPNTPPQIQKSQPSMAIAGQPWSYQVIATDLDVPKQTIRYSLTEKLPGMTIDASTGQIRWTPDLLDAGKSFTFAVEVDDQFGGKDNAIFSVGVNQDRRPVLSFDRNQITVLENVGKANIPISILRPGIGSLTLTTIGGTNLPNSIANRAFPANDMLQGDYLALTNTIVVTDATKNLFLPVQIYDDPIYTGERTFEIQLSVSETDGIIAGADRISIVIQDDESTGPSGEAQDGSSRGWQPGTIKAVPSNYKGIWRFPWSDELYNSENGLATGLELKRWPIEWLPNGDSEDRDLYLHVDLQSFSNGLIPPPKVGTLANTYSSLRVELRDQNQSPFRNGRWRFKRDSTASDTNWYSSNQVLTNIRSGRYLIEFKNVENYVEPAPRIVEIADDCRLETTVIGYYGEKAPHPSKYGLTRLTSIQLKGSDSQGIFVGQLIADGTFSSGVLVRPRVVLTAAHALFQPGSTNFYNNILWFQRRHRGEIEPLPISVTGVAVAPKYIESLVANRFNATSASVRAHDYAAIYFAQDVVNDLYSGYITNSFLPNQQNLSIFTKRGVYKSLVGYPVAHESRPLFSNGGIMYQVAKDTTDFFPWNSEGGLMRNASLLGIGGMSGAPLFIQYNGYQYPAAIYLGRDGIGGEGNGIFRVIDDAVAQMIDRAERGAYKGENHNGGVITFNASIGTSEATKQTLVVNISSYNEEAGRKLWKVQTDGRSEIQRDESTNSIRLTANKGYKVIFSEVDGWQTPQPVSIKLPVGQDATLNITYEPQRRPNIINPTAAKDNIDFVLEGTPGTTVIIEHSESIIGTKWTPIAERNLVATNTPFSIKRPSESGFLRARIK